MKDWWNEKAWPWLKANWQWVLLPIGILMLVAKGGRKTTVVASELTGAAEFADKADKEAAEQAAAAKAERDALVDKISEEHLETVEKLTMEQVAEVNDLLEDPEELNNYLLDVGKQIRSDETE